MSISPRTRVSKRLQAVFAGITIVFQLFLVAGPAISVVFAADPETSTPVLTTDKADYFPGDVVHVTGSNFETSASLTLTITAGVLGDEDYLNFADPVTTNSVGGFLYDYQIDDIFRPLYVVKALDADGTVLAETSFTDASIGSYNQCSNDDGDGYATGDTGCRWTNGNIQSNNSTYFEGDSTVQKLWIEGFVPGSNHTITLQYGTTKGGKHAYDFLTTWDWSENWITEADLCQDVDGCATVSENTFPIPNDPGYSGEFEFEPRNFVMRGADLTAATVPALESGSYAADSETVITVSFTVAASGDMCKTKQGVTTCGMVLWFGAHISKTSEWFPFDGTEGATSITGSPYHVALSALDGASVGQRDNQMQAGAIVAADEPTVATAIHLGTNHATDVQGTTIALGSTIHDQATVDNTGGANGIPEGTVTFDYFTNGTCAGNPADTSSALALVNGVVDATGFAKGPLGTGSYSFLAHYVSSDTAQWIDADGLCETVSVGQGTSTVATTLHNSSEGIVAVGDSIPLGTVMHDLATVTPSSTFAPTGNVTFTFFNNNTCSGDGTAMGSVALNGANPGVAHPSNSTAALAAGSYSFRATWAGDSNYTGNTSSCENFIVTQGTSSIVTELHQDDETVVAVGGHVALGTVMHDSATVTVAPGFAAPTGNVTFTFYNNGICEGIGTFMGSVALSGNPGVAHPSLATAALAAGDYSFKATWPGDANYTDSLSSCENFTVDKAQLTVTTEVHDASDTDITNGSVALGSITHDTATVTGDVAGFAVPTPTFTLTSNYTDSCAAGSAVGNDGIDTGNSANKSADSAALGAGNYAYRGFVAGNDNYIGDTSDCEPFTVNKAQLEVTTAVHDVLDVDQTNQTVPLGSVMHDTATVSGTVDGFTIPTPTFTITSDYVEACDAGSAVVNDGTEGGAAKSVASSPLAAGSYAYRGEVAGNDNYIGDVSPCEPFIVDKADLDIATELHRINGTVVPVGTEVPLGTTMHDQAMVTGIDANFDPANNVDFTFYENGICEEGSAAGSVALDASGIAHPSDSKGPLGAGDYSFQASIANDDNYNGAISDCEPFTVLKDTPDVVTEIHDTNHAVVTVVDLGATVHDQATVTGIGVTGLEPTGDVDFLFFNNDQCEPEGDASGTVALDELDPGTAHPSDSQGPLGAGGYAFKAHYVGDANYVDAFGPCEPLTVNKAQLEVTTEVHNTDHEDITSSNTALGSVVHDTATVTGEVAGFALPEVSFTFTTDYTDACDAGSAVENDGTEESSTKSEDSDPLTPGEYAYRGSVASNDNYIGDISPCEPFTVNQSDSSVSTELHMDDETPVQVGGSVAAGTDMHDSATVTANGVFHPTGDVSFTFYTNDTCTPEGTPAGALALDGVSNPSSAHPSDSTGALEAGLYSFSASWNGDSNYTGNISSCENFNVVDASIALSPLEATNKINDEHEIFAHVTQNDGTGVTDVEGATVEFSITGSATFVGDVDSCVTDATGMCSITIVSSTTGSNTVNATTTFTVGGVALTRATDGNSGPDGTGAATKNYVNARISINPVNDTNPVNQPHDFVVTVEKDTGFGFEPVEGALVNLLVIPSPDSLLQIDCHDGTDASGQCTATINSSTPGVFTAYARSNILVNGVQFKLQTDGTGDNSGPAVKTYVDVTVTTVIHEAGDESTNYDLNANPNGGNLPLGSIVHDSATVTPSSGTILGGSITYSMYDNGTCAGDPVSVEADVSLGSESSDTEPLAPGDYSYIAHFNGDYPYPEKDGACERLHIDQGTSTNTTELHEDSTHDVIALGGESITGNVHDQASVSVDPVFADPTGSVTFRFYATQAACAADTEFTGGIEKGTVALVSGVAHPSDATGTLTAGNYAFKAMWPGDDNYEGNNSDCENFTVTTLTINKLANGGNDTFGYTVAGPTGLTPNITTSGIPGVGTTGALVVLAGDYTVGETTIPTGWQFVGLSCAGVAGSDPTSASFNIPAGTNGTCDFENTKAGATRTIGFWSTHTEFANDVWTNDVPDSEKNINNWGALCTVDKFIDADPSDNELMGGFWAGIAKKSTGANRTNLDKARMVLLQQLLGAELNVYGIGTNDGGLIAAAKTAYCGSNLNAIKTATGALDSFNNSGDDVPLGFSVPSATPKVSKLQADIPFWNNPTF